MHASSSSSKSGRPPGKLVARSENFQIFVWSCLIAPVADLHLQVCIVPQQLGHPASKGKDNEEKEEHPLDNVNDHLAKGDLERTQVGVDGEQVGHLLDIL